MSGLGDLAQQKHEDAGAPNLKGNKLLLISNRLPITIKKDKETGKYNMSGSSGGLVTGLSGMTKTTDFLWYGWPGLEVAEDQVESFKTNLREEYNSIPVFLDDKLADKHYNGMSSK
jgi:trehalose 6-phosphate synthase